MSLLPTTLVRYKNVATKNQAINVISRICVIETAMISVYRFLDVFFPLTGKLQKFCKNTLESTLNFH